MDTLTHALTGAVISNLGFKKKVPGATFTLVTASVLPDIDWASRFFGIAAYLNYHRSFTHSLLGVISLAMILTLIVKLFFRRADLRMTFLLSLFGGLFHLLMDLINPYGTQVFYPFLAERYAWNWVTVVDLFITMPLILCLLLIRHLRLSPVKTASVALGFVILFISSKGICHQIALKELNELSRPVEETFKAAVYPDLFSPFVWTGVVETDRAYRIVSLNILRSEWSNLEDHIKPERNEFTQLAEKSLLVKTYLKFARHPLLYYQEVKGYHFVSWQDLSFGLRGKRGLVVLVILNRSGEILYEHFSFFDPKLHPEQVKRLIEKTANP
jgi:inner membrane protein